MNKIPMNLEQTVQYLLDEVQKLKAGIAPGELIPGPQGVPGPEGPAPVVTISNSTGNWVIDGVDTGKPSRGKQGEKGATGMQGIPGISARDMLSIDSTDYTPTITDDGEYKNIESSAEIKFTEGGSEQSTQIDFNIKVPDQETFAGDGLTKNGRTLSVDRNMTPVYDDFGHYAGLVPMTTGDRVWGQAFVSNDPVPYAIAQRNSSGGLTGIQDKLYLHVGRILMNGNTYYYKIVNRREDAFINAESGFTDEEPDNYVFLVSSGGQNNRTLLDFKYDSWDEKHYFHTLSAPQTQSGYVSANLTIDTVYEI